MTDGQVLMALYPLALAGVLALIFGGGWLVARLRHAYDPYRPQRRANQALARTHDNAAAALDGHRGVSTDSAKESA